MTRPRLTRTQKTAEEALYRGAIAGSSGPFAPGPNGDVWSMVGGVPQWAVPMALVGGLPLRGLTLAFSMLRSVTIDPISSLVVAVGNLAAGAQYFKQISGTAPAYNATGINGTPALVVRHVDSPLFEAASSNNTIDNFLSPPEWTIAGSLQYTGARVLNLATLRTMPQIIGVAVDPPNAPGVCIAVDTVDPTKARIVAYWTPDDVTYYFVESAALTLAAPHYFVVTYQAVPGTDSGTLSLYVDALPVVTSASNIYSSISQWQSQTFRMFSNAISTNSSLDALVGEIDTWQVCLTAAEIAQVRATLKANGGYP